MEHYEVVVVWGILVLLISQSIYGKLALIVCSYIFYSLLCEQNSRLSRSNYDNLIDTLIYWKVWDETIFKLRKCLFCNLSAKNLNSFSITWFPEWSHNDIYRHCSCPLLVHCSFFSAQMNLLHSLRSYS